MSGLHLSLGALDTFSRGLKESKAMTQREMLAAMDEATLALQARIQSTFPQGKERPLPPKSRFTVKGSNNTRNSYTSDAWATDMGVLGVVGSSQLIALFVEEGTKPHEIRPKGPPLGAKALAFPLGVSPVAPLGQSGGFMVTKLVHHPGTKAQKISEKAYEQLKPLIIDMFERAAERVAKQLTTGRIG